MARLGLGQKIDRVISFMLGLRNPRAAEILMSHGFEQNDLDAGWSLLRTVVGERLSLSTPVERPDPHALNELDAWENKWFPIARASLASHYPAVGERVFANLSQTRGAEVVVSVDTFVSRVVALGDGGSDDAAARQLLQKRGLTADEIGSAQKLIQQLSQIKEAAPTLEDTEAAREARAAAESDLWAWYREWSTIARVAITDRRLLRQLGFLRGSPVSGDVGPEAAADVEDAEEALEGAAAAP